MKYCSRKEYFSFDQENSNKQLEEYCVSPFVQYPVDAIIISYISVLHNITGTWWTEYPDFVELKLAMTWFYRISPVNMFLCRFDELLCKPLSNNSVMIIGDYDQFCHMYLKTFNKYSYHFIDICNRSRECISAYCIEDGSPNCADNINLCRHTSDEY